MIVNNMSVKNDSISFDNVKLSFSSVGIHIIAGPNGAGKTTLLNEILFGSCDVDFSNKEYMLAYGDRRHLLFAYVPQIVPDINIKISDIIKRGDGNSRVHDIYREFLATTGNHADRQINTLSGGERALVAVIAAFLKDTPYIFLDEPTNNMDDKTVEAFLSIVKEYALRKTIVIVSHDPRMKVDAVSKISITNEGIVQTPNRVAIPSVGIGLPIAAHSLFRTILKTTISTRSICVYVAVLLALVTLSVFIDGEMAGHFSLQSLPPKGEILIAPSDGVFSEVNKAFTDSIGVSINKRDYSKEVKFSDIPQIYDNDGIKTIYIMSIEYFSTEYFDRQSEIESHELGPSFPILSIPDAFKRYADYAIDTRALSLDSGRLPLDGKKEVSISRDLLIKHFGYSDNIDNNSPIGGEIKINDDTYTIVGLTYMDICLLSYHKGDNLGFYEYDKDTFEQFKDSELAYCEKSNRINPDRIESALIMTDASTEKKAVSRIVQAFPANSYKSYIFDYAWLANNNADALKRIMLITFPITAILALIALFIFRSKFAADTSRIRYYEIFYMDNRRPKRIYYMMIMLQLLLAGLLAIIFNAMYSSYAFADTYVLAAGYLVVFIPVLIQVIIRYRNA